MGYTPVNPAPSAPPAVNLYPTHPGAAQVPMGYILYAPLPTNEPSPAAFAPAATPVVIAADDSEHVVVIEPDVPATKIPKCLGCFWGFLLTVEVILSILDVGFYLGFMSSTGGFLPVVCIYAAYVVFATIVSIISNCSHGRISKKALKIIFFITPIAHLVISIIWLIINRWERHYRHALNVPPIFGFILFGICLIKLLVFLKVSKYDNFGESTCCQSARNKVTAKLESIPQIAPYLQAQTPTPTPTVN